MRRDFTYIDNIVSGIVSALNKNLGYEIINLGNNNPDMLDDVVNLLEEYMGVKVDRNYQPMQPGDVSLSNANIDKAKKLLNYNPTIKIEDGLRRFINWFNQYSK